MDSAIALSVTWNMVPDIDQNGIITLYEVSYQPMEDYNNTVLLQNTTDLSRSLFLTGLHEYANYSVQVRAYTSVGPGDYSMEEFAWTLEAGKWCTY